MRSVTLLVLSLAACAGPGDETDSGDAVDTDPVEDTDTDEPTGPCATPKVTFTPDGGGAQDITTFFETGEYLTLAIPGTLEVCPGTWFARVLLRADVTVRGLGETPEQTVLSGGESGTILDVLGPDVHVTVENLTLDRGAGLDVEHNSGGGGVYCEQQGLVTVTDVRFTNNFANDGSGLYSRDCTVDIARSTFTGNLSEDDGGAVTFWFSTVTLEEVEITDNVALDGGGMAAFNSDVTMTDSVVSGNTATQFAAGVWAYESNVIFEDVELEQNVNEGVTQYGGGLVVHGTAELTRVDFVNNSAPKGGGLFVYYDAVVDGTSCDFAGNEPDDIYAADDPSGHSYDAGSSYSFSCAENACARN